MPKNNDIDGVIEEIRAALDPQLLPDAETRELLLAAIRVAVEELTSPDEDAPPAARSRPAVTLVEGGRGDDPPSPGERPVLRVADPEDPDSAANLAEGFPLSPETAAATAATAALLHTVLFGAGDDPEEADSDGDSEEPALTPDELLVDGQIHLTREATEQTLFVGAMARPYRLYLEAGAVLVHIPDEEPFLLHAEQRVDVEARRVRVTLSPPNTVAVGIYQRLPRVLR